MKIDVWIHEIPKFMASEEIDFPVVPRVGEVVNLGNPWFYEVIQVGYVRQNDEIKTVIWLGPCDFDPELWPDVASMKVCKSA